MAGSKGSGERDRDLVRRALDRLYGRIGGRIALVCVVGAIPVGFLTLVVTGVWSGRYLRLSTSDVALAIAITMPVFTAVSLVTVWWSRSLPLVLSWSGRGRTGERAPETWNGVIRLLFAEVPAIGVFLGVFAGPVSIVLFLLISGKSVQTGLGLLLSGWVGLTAGLVVITSAGELLLRPMLEDVASYLPPDFEPEARSLRLRSKALAPLLPVTLFAALTAGAYVDLVSRGLLRLAVAIGIALATIAVAAVIFWIVSKAVLDPIDELLAATRRVSEGDIATPVPLVAADELGELAIGFNEMLANLRRHERELEESRARIVTAGDSGRRRVERDLHDGAQQQLVLINLKLGLMERLGQEDPAQAIRMTGEIRADLERALEELRDLAHGIYPAVLESEGLAGALEEAVERVAIPTEVESNGTGRYRSEIEAAVYFCCLEALQNAAKHAGDDARATVRLAERDGGLSFVVADDGVGFDASAAQSSAGIQNMRDRMGALGGSIILISSPGAGTSVAGEIPVR